MMPALITGLFETQEGAERAIDELERLGYSPSDIGVAMNGHASQPAVEPGTDTAAGAGIGATFGGALGAIIAGLTATGAIVGTGGIAAPIVAGPLAAVFAGAGAGGLTGGIIGALVGAGVPESEAERYEDGLHRGAIAVALNPRPGDESRVQAILGAPAALNGEGLRAAS
jgi:hypothetical protein